MKSKQSGSIEEIQALLILDSNNLENNKFNFDYKDHVQENIKLRLVDPMKPKFLIREAAKEKGNLALGMDDSDPMYYRMPHSLRAIPMSSGLTKYFEIYNYERASYYEELSNQHYDDEEDDFIDHYRTFWDKIQLSIMNWNREFGEKQKAEFRSAEVANYFAIILNDLSLVNEFDIFIKELFGVH